MTKSDRGGGPAEAFDERGFGDEGARLGGRLRRFAQVGGEVGWLAAQLAGNRVLGTTLDKGRHSRQLKAALGGLKGPLMKAAQILATIPDALPREYAEELRQLQSNAPPMGWPFVRRRMRSELGAGWEGRFESFGREAAAAASLGQVHKAERDGRLLACKLQYPDMASAVEADVQQLRLAFSVYRQYDRAIDTSEIYAELTARLREELDYEREARHMALYRRMLAEEAGVTVPEPLPELTTRRLLTMTWLEGRPLLEVAAGADQETRNRIALNMFRAWYVPFYFYGVIHGDPHLGNYSVRPDGGVNLLDFGCVRVFRPGFVEGVIDLYRAFESDDDALAVKAYESWGFAGIADKPELMAALNIWARFLYKPLLEDKAQSIMGEAGSFAGAEAAGQVHKELRRLGGVRPPREFVLMDRAAIGLGSVFLHLKAEINWHRVFRELIAGFDARALAKRQKAALKAVGLPEEVP
ncbi:Predicted unusual protein kinase regulating ubiquinone biosynthesis, AarF/ABC1/UbiB family [Tistlia consotensis]|uniref:Predicted unusual protein kinase regulating ubiquinone biosynthesis, AarF/ABC1/UbiB family n=1 Tax=Tistlia consotensis USBA 355 TaxID=560819 RepID=A0A1Y6B485_9PROT|nr:AarF/UbiB family protein [Tistlia consotensis]SME89184.1 Predicted unusual protein kinase regulating ubiquinone biosynthesis, AarF/ABC1/UbiB family [Tistlia consotensis USBA 355]SNR25751.1 Predicted unusual protein kinase regulating ubiquinone biosynthesis, AarF/ABC1/UbiB family [Tistlia consotensis]